MSELAVGKEGRELQVVVKIGKNVMIRLAKTYAIRHSYWQDTSFNLQCNELGCLDRHAFQTSHPSQIDRFPEVVEVDKILIHEIQSAYLMISCFVKY